MSFKLAFQGFFMGIVFTLCAIVVVFLKVLERVEKKYQVKRAALEEQNRKFLSEVKKRKETISSAAPKPEGVREKDAELNVYGIPPPFDPSTAWVIDGKLHMQLGGKKKTNTAKYAYLTNNVLYFCSKKGASYVDSFNIEGSLLKKAETETKLKAAIEVLNPSRPYLYPPRVDYFYLILKSEKEMERWYFAMLACGCTQHPTGSVAQVPAAAVVEDEASESSSGSGSTSDLHSAQNNLTGNLIKHSRTEVHRKGWLTVQKEDSKSCLRRYALLDNQDLMLYESEKVLSSSSETINLALCEVTLSNQKKHKYALELRRKGMEICPGVDYFTLVFESESDRDVWQLALNASTQGSIRGSPTIPHRRASDAGQGSALTADKFRLNASDAGAKGSLLEPIVPAHQLSETRRKETVEWLNPLIARFWQNIRVNPTVTAAIKDKLSKKLMQKVNEKKLTGYLANVTVDEVDLGDAIPVLQSAKLLEPRIPGEVSLDLSIVFRGQMRTRISASVILPMISPVSFSALAAITVFEGKLNLNCPPFPAERFSISFYSEPKTEISVQTFLGDKAWLNQLPKVHELIISRLRLAIVERLVAPNRRYARMPKSATADELKSAYAALLVASGVPPEPSLRESAKGSAGSQSVSAGAGNPNPVLISPAPSSPAAFASTAPVTAPTPNTSSLSIPAGSAVQLPRMPSPEHRSKRERLSALISSKTRKGSATYPELTDTQASRIRKYFQRWYYKTQYRIQLRRKRLVMSLRDQERLYVQLLRQLGELYGSAPFEPYTRMAEVAALFADMFMLLSYHQQLNENLFQRTLRWNAESYVGDLMVDTASFIKEEETKYHLKYQHFITVTLAEWNKSAPQRYAAFRALRVGDQTVEDALATPLQSVGRYLAWCEAALLATHVGHADRLLLDTAIKKLKALAEGVAPHKFRNTLKNLFAHK